MIKKELGQTEQVEPVSQNKKRASFYEGVSRHKLKGNKVWKAEFTYGEETKHLGYYATESDAACAHDAGLHEHVIGIEPMSLKDLKFNFYNFRHISNPDEANVQIKKPEQYKHIPQKAREAMKESASSSPKLDTILSSSTPKRSIGKSSAYIGVSSHALASAENKWVAQFKHQKKTTFLGLFKSEEDAARAYDAAIFREFKDIKGIQNIKFNFPDEAKADGFEATIEAALAKRIRSIGKHKNSNASAAAAMTTIGALVSENLTQYEQFSEVLNNSPLWLTHDDEEEEDVAEELGRLFNSAAPSVSPSITSSTPIQPLFFRTPNATPTHMQPHSSSSSHAFKKPRLN